jgi:hypothetical protein
MKLKSALPLSFAVLILIILSVYIIPSINNKLITNNPLQKPSQQNQNTEQYTFKFNGVTDLFIQFFSSFIPAK